MIRLLLFVPIWLVYLFLIKLPTIIVGLLVVPLLYRYRKTDYEDLPWWTRPWSNLEDWQGGTPGYGIESVPHWWIKREGLGFKSFYKYHAIRNGADGLRSFKWFVVSVDPRKIKYKTEINLVWYEPWKMRELGIKSVVYLCWQGWKAGLKWVYIHDDKLHTVLKLGWRIEPKYAELSIDEVADDRLLQTRSFATKFLYKHEDQTSARDYDK
jgi:hypothetical protein